MEDIIIILIVLVIVVGAAAYVYNQKKKGATCIGCPHSKTCGKHKCNCGNTFKENNEK